MSSNKPTWRGVSNVYMIWHGVCADPGLKLVRGCFYCIANYYDVENSMYDSFREWVQAEGIDVQKDTSDEEYLFNAYCRENKHLVYAYLTNAGEWHKNE